VDRPLDYTKDFKELYLPKKDPAVIDVPKMPFIMIEGEGDPNGKEFGLVVEALYSLSYTIKMSYKRPDAPEGYFPYKVFPLEGVWDLKDLAQPFDKSNFAYTMMIRQPDFVTKEYFEFVKEFVHKKKPNPAVGGAGFTYLSEGVCCQMMHIGSYDDEPASFARMEAYCRENGYVRASKTHREIYLSDPRRTEKSRLKTVLRFRVEKV
jgi:hypothetical protein